MSLYNELNTVMPQQHFYEVISLSFADALDRCARMTGNEGNVFTFNGKTIFACHHPINGDNDWLVAVEGTPVETATEA